MLKPCCACLQICAFAYYSAPLYYITEKALRVHHKPFYIRVPCRYPVGGHALSLHPCSLCTAEVQLACAPQPGLHNGHGWLQARPALLLLSALVSCWRGGLSPCFRCM